MTRYFAYGSNMDPVHMAARCPGAVQRGVVLLRGYHFRIAAKGYGTTQAAPGGVTRGVLWDLEAADEAALDLYEGISEGDYYKDSAMVELPDTGQVRVMLYRATDPAPGHPVSGYLERIIEVAEALEFPPDYLGELRRLLPTP